MTCMLIDYPSQMHDRLIPRWRVTEGPAHNGEDFDSSRIFSRYINKTKDFLNNTMRSIDNCVPPEMQSPCNFYYDYVIYYIRLYYTLLYEKKLAEGFDVSSLMNLIKEMNLVTETEEENIRTMQGIAFIHSFKSCCIQHVKDETTYEYDTDFLSRVLSDPLQDMGIPGTSLYSLIDKEIKAVCKEYICLQEMIGHEGLCLSNIISRALPEDEMDFWWITTELCKKLIMDIDTLNARNRIQMTTGNEQSEQYLKEISGLKIALRNEETKSKQLKQETEALSIQLENECQREFKETRKLNGKIKEYEKEIIELKRQLAKKDKQIDGLNEKIERLKENPDSAKASGITTPGISETVINDTVLDGHYMFLVGNDDSEVMSRLLAEFPGAKICRNETEFAVGKYDAVVCLTRTTGHPFYYKVRDKCNSCGIRFVHCENRNIERIKNEMKKVLASP